MATATANGVASPFKVSDKESLVSYPSSTPQIRFTKLFINGEFVDAVKGKKFDVYNPVKGDKIASVSEADIDDVNVAVKAAREAYDNVWRHIQPATKADLMFKLADLMTEHLDELAALDALDNGKPFQVAKYFDVSECIKTIRYYAGWATKIQGKTITPEGPYEARTRHEAIGVVGAIIPWNFPLLMACWKIGPCLACGNTLVIKSSEKTPLSLLLLAELTRQAGFPPGVFNVLNGYGPTAGQPLAEHMDVDKIAFTGSTAVGKKVMRAAAESNLKKCTVELGGKSPSIVFPDADLDVAVAGTHLGIFFNAGQCCCAGSRVFVHSSIYDEFVKRATIKAKELPLSYKNNTGSALQPVVDDLQHKRVLELVESGKAEGATVACGGNKGDKTFYVEPTIFTDVKDHMRIAKEEIFGPVMSVLKFETIEEVIKRANNSIYGLASSVFTQDINKATYVANNLKAGTVWVNCHNVLSYAIPFGGYKQSGIGRDLGEYALHEYTQVKAIISNIVQDPSKLKININA